MERPAPLTGAGRHRRALLVFAAIAMATSATILAGRLDGPGRTTHSPMPLDQVTAALQRRARSDRAPTLTPGRLFYAKVAYRDLAVRVDGRGGPWASRYRQVVSRWVAADGSARLLFRGGSSTLVGPRDRVRWLADGSPTLTAASGKSWEVDYRPGRFVGGNLRAEHLTLGDLLSLPTSSRALERRLERLLPSVTGASRERAKVEAIAELIAGAPSPPALRAALYAVLARIPGLGLDGTVIDPYGRKGLALAVRDDVARTIVVVDPASSRVLGLETITLRRLPYADAGPGAVVSERWYLEGRIVRRFRGHLVPRRCSLSGSGFGCWVWSR